MRSYAPAKPNRRYLLFFPLSKVLLNYRLKATKRLGQEHKNSF